MKKKHQMTELEFEIEIITKIKALMRFEWIKKYL